MSILSKFRALLTLGQGLTRGVTELDVGDDPVAYFQRWFNDAQRAGIMLPEAMTLATCTRDGVPSARMVLLKGVDERGFVFFTNYESRKSADLQDNPRAALVFHWNVLQRQVRIEGNVEQIGQADSDAYFQRRARGSQIGAWASKQSAELGSREELLEHVQEYERKYAGTKIPLPPFWGGYRVSPARIEFWQGRANRLHDRLAYRRNDDTGKWSVSRLYP
jgi:pyridoxamine 5'-phosphate oxidase